MSMIRKATNQELISFLKDLRAKLQSRSIYKEEYRQIDQLLKLLEEKKIKKNPMIKRQTTSGERPRSRISNKSNLGNIAKLAKKVLKFLEPIFGGDILG